MDGGDRYAVGRDNAGADGVGARVAHLYRDQFLTCEWRAYVGAPNDAVVPKLATSGCLASEDPAVRWEPDGGVVLIAVDGGPVAGPITYTF